MADTNYDPYDNREIEAPLSYFDALFLLVKCVIGTGILAMPWAFALSGYGSGTIWTILCMILLIYGIHLLIKCMVESSRRNEVGYMTYRETMVYACSVGPGCIRHFSKASGYLIDGILCFSHYGVCVVYIVFAAVNFQQFADDEIATIDLRIWIAIIGVLSLPLFLIRHLKYLVPANIFATLLVLFGLLAIFYYLLTDLPPLGDREIFRKGILYLPSFLGIVMFATSSVGVMLAIESKMADPASYLSCFGVLNVSAVFVIVTNVAFAFFGYWRYGDMVSASVTLDIPTKEILAQIIKLAIAFAIFLTYPLSGYVVIDVIVNGCMNSRKQLKNPHLTEYIARIIFVVLSTLNAIAFPNLGPLLALVGAFSISLLNLIFPCLIEICLCNHGGHGVLLWKLWKNILIIIFGMFVLCYGSYIAIRQMIDAYIIRNK